MNPAESPAAAEEGTSPWQHTLAAVSEGLCPVHYTALEPAALNGRRVAGHCGPCHVFWGANLDTQVTGWWLDHDPRQPYSYGVPVPDWMRQHDR